MAGICLSDSVFKLIDYGQSVVEGFAPLGGWMMEDGWMDRRIPT